MPLFAVIGLDHPPHAMAKRDAVRSEHGDYVVTHDQAIMLVAPFLDDQDNQCGTLYLFEAEGEAEVRAWLEQEPFVSQGVYAELIIRRLKLGLNRLAVQDWPARPSRKAVRTGASD